MVSALSISTFLSGCGSSGSGKKVDEIKKVQPTPAKKEEQPIQSVEVIRDDDKIEFNITDDLDYPNAIIVDNHEGLKIAKTKNYLYLTFTHNSVNAQNIQFFIDLDSDSKTGYKSEGGAEYKIENGQLHIFADNNGTDSWEAYLEKDGEDSVKVNTVLNKSDSVRIAGSLFEKDQFSVNAQALDTNWTAQISSPRSQSKTFFSNSTINDLNLTNIETYAEDINNSLELKISDDENFIKIYLLQNNFRDHMQFYIDIDNNAETGERFDGNATNKWVGFGADYMIEQGKLVEYNDTSGAWDWDNPKDIISQQWKEDQKIVSLQINKEYLNLKSNRLSVAVELSDKDWSNTLFLPKVEETPQEYILSN
jgi:hypothetical protein